MRGIWSVALLSEPLVQAAVGKQIGVMKGTDPGVTVGHIKPAFLSTSPVPRENSLWPACQGPEGLLDLPLLKKQSPRFYVKSTAV